MKNITIPTPAEFLTAFRVIENEIDITETVQVRHLFNPRRVIVESEIPINGFIEII